MQPTLLSSNWKKLQKQLEEDAASKKKLHSHPRHNNGINYSPNSSRPLKRKAHTALSAPTNTQPVAKIQKTQVASSRTKNTKMGAYISSLAGYKTNSTNTAPASNPTAATPADNQTAAHAHTTGKYIALDCEMVGTTTPTLYATPSHHQPPGTTTPEYSVLARVSLVSYTSTTLYDAYVLPPLGVPITNYRTAHSGITPRHLHPKNGAKPFEAVQADVAALLHGRVLVGHAVKNDLAVLGLTHPGRDVRDTSRYGKFREMAAVTGRDGRMGKGRTPSLRKLAGEVLGWEIQREGGEARGGVVGHDSVEDARAAMALFRKEKDGFEAEVGRKYGKAAGGRWRGEMMGTVGVVVENDGVDEDDWNNGIVLVADDDGSGGEEDEEGEAVSGSPKKKSNKKKRKKRKKPKTQRH